MDDGQMNPGEMAPPPSMMMMNMNMNSSAMGESQKTMAAMMHMSFFWGSDAEILFPGWPGTRPGMYAVALVFIFAVAVAVEWLSHAKLMKPEMNSVTAGLGQTVMHAVRITLGYFVMLAVMSFNVGVLMVAVGGHSVGFMLFGSRIFRKPGVVVSSYDKQPSDLPPMSC